MIMFLCHQTVGDEGQALGTYQHADYVLNNNKHLTNTYAGIYHGFIANEKVDYKEVAQNNRRRKDCWLVSR